MTGNGYDPLDSSAPYVFVARFYMIVQRGRELRGLITDDMTLTKEYFWLVAGGVGIDAGVTVTVSEGTQVQWSGYTPNDPYSDPERAEVTVWGSLLLHGTYDEPVEMFPSELDGNGRDVYINFHGSQNSGVFHTRYVKVDAPEWGYAGIYYGPNSIDHSYIYANKSAWDTGFSMTGNPGSTTNSIVEMWDGTNGFNPGNADTVLFHAKGAGRHYPFPQGLVTNSVFLQNNAQNYAWTGFWQGCGGDCFSGKDAASAGTRHRGNAFLSKYWDPNPNHWMRFGCYYTNPI